jgi:4-oxalocrotonate tautomerase
VLYFSSTGPLAPLAIAALAQSRSMNLWRATTEALLPYVNIKITREGATAEQKAKLIKGATDLLANVLQKDPATTFVVIDEVEMDNWGIAGESVTARRQKPK